MLTLQTTTTKVPWTTGKTAVLVGTPVAIAVLIVAVFLLLHGYFDRARFEVLRTTRYPSNQIALIAKRSDKQAMNNDQVFVVIADHVSTPDELRHAYYYDGVVFRAGSDCLTARWISQTQLLIGCAAADIDSGSIAVEKKQASSISVSYANIPPKH